MDPRTGQIIQAILEGFGYTVQVEDALIPAPDEPRKFLPVDSVVILIDDDEHDIVRVSRASKGNGKQAARVLMEYGFAENMEKDGLWRSASIGSGPAEKLTEEAPRLLRAMIRVARRINERRTREQEYGTNMWLCSLEADIWETVAEILGRRP